MALAMPVIGVGNLAVQPSLDGSTQEFCMPASLQVPHRLAVAATRVAPVSPPAGLAAS